MQDSKGPKRGSSTAFRSPAEEVDTKREGPTWDNEGGARRMAGRLNCDESAAECRWK
jgi:hypothetical protein